MSNLIDKNPNITIDKFQKFMVTMNGYMSTLSNDTTTTKYNIEQYTRNLNDTLNKSTRCINNITSIKRAIGTNISRINEINKDIQNIKLLLNQHIDATESIKILTAKIDKLKNDYGILKSKNQIVLANFENVKSFSNINVLKELRDSLKTLDDVLIDILDDFPA
jgi:hypothetical protein